MVKALKAAWDAVLTFLCILRVIDGSGRVVWPTVVLGATVAIAGWSVASTGKVDAAAAGLVVAALAARAVDYFLVQREQSVQKQAQEALAALVGKIDENFKAANDRVDALQAELAKAQYASVLRPKSKG